MKKFFVFLLFTGLISFIPSSLHPLFSSSLSAQIPSNGLVAWYPFNGNANDESGNGNHGTVNGATLTTDRFGNANGAYYFNLPSGHVSIPNITNQLSTSNLTISLWFKKEGNYYPANPRLVDFGSTNPGIWSPEYDSNFDVIHYYWPLTGASATSETLVPRNNNWHHLVVSFHGDSNFLTEVYLDGVLSSTTCCSTPGPNGMDLNWLIGRGNSGESTDQWVGKIDDVSIYGNTMTAEDVQQLYQDQTGQVQQPLTCNITAPTTTLCAGESVNLSISATGGAGSSTQLPANLQQGLVAYYPFNGNANDESGNGNNGTVNGATLTADRFGNVNSAFDFSNSYINVPNSSSLQINTSLTISLWVKFDSFPTVSCIFSKGSDEPSSADSWVAWFFPQGNNGSGGLNIFQQTSSQPACGAGVDGISANSWHNIMFVFNGDSASCFFNGIMVQNTSCNRNVFSNVFDLKFGRMGHPSGGWPYYMDGKLDEIGIWNRALSPSEIQQLYTSQSYAWSTGAITNSISVSPTTYTTYSCTVTQGNQTCTASIDIAVNPAVTNTVNATIAQGQSYTLGTQTLTTAGTYTEVFTSAAGCDSTVTLTLAVEPLLTCNITAPTTALCAGESVNLSVNASGGNEITPNLTNLMFLTNYEGHDYYLYTDFLSWEDAKTYGDENGLSMYIVNSAAEANAVYQTLPFLGVDNVHY